MNILPCIFICVIYLNACQASRFKYVFNEIDLTWSFDNNTFHWKDSSQFIFSKQISGSEQNGYWYANNEFCVGEHTGTHFDAPYHLNEKGWKVGEVPLHRLIANGVTIDLSDETEMLKENARLLPKHILQWERKHGTMPINSVILVKFGWSQYYSTSEYLGLDEHNVTHYPGISKEAADLIADLETVVGVGVDTASVEPGNTTGRTIHRIFAKNQIYILESVNIPHDLPDSDYILYVMPMKIKDGSGAPLRLIAQPNRRQFESGLYSSSSVITYHSCLSIIAGLILQFLK